MIYDSRDLVCSERPIGGDNITYNDVIELQQHKFNWKFLSVLLEQLDGQHILLWTHVVLFYENEENHLPVSFEIASCIN